MIGYIPTNEDQEDFDNYTDISTTVKYSLKKILEIK